MSKKTFIKRDGTLWNIIAISGFPLSLVLYMSLAIYGYYTIALTSLFLYFIVMRVISLILCCSFEFLIPWSDKKLEKNELKTDITYYFANNFIIRPVIASVIIAIITFIESTHVLFSIFDISWMPKFWCYLVLFIAVEFGAYWGHRILHTNKFFWRGHATHHSSRRMYWLNNLRNNFLSYVLVGALIVGPAILLGAPEEFLAINYALFILLGPYQHINADFKMGWLNYIFSAAPNHRFHHSVNPNEANSNFSRITMLFDLVFATFIHGDRFKKEMPMGFFKDIKGYKRHNFIFQELIPYNQKFWKDYKWKKTKMKKQRLFYNKDEQSEAALKDGTCKNDNIIDDNEKKRKPKAN